MSAAIFGLVGVVIGGLLNHFVIWYRERTARKAEYLVARRLVRSEVYDSMIFLGVATDPETWKEDFMRDLARSVGLKDAAWQQHSQVLARHLDDEAWTSVADAYQLVEHMKIIMGSPASGNDRLAGESRETKVAMAKAHGQLHRVEDEVKSTPFSSLRRRLPRSRRASRAD